MRRRNVFTGDRSYAQTLTLTYSDRMTETRFAYDWTRLVPWVLTWWRGGLLVLTCGLWLWQQVSLLHTLCLGVLLLLTTKTTDPVLTRSVWVLVDFWLAHLLFPVNRNWTQSDYFACIFPGFMASTSYADILLLPRWLYGLTASLVEVVLCTVPRSGQISNAVLPLLFWTTLSCILEKDRRDYWALSDSYKRSEGQFKTLFHVTKLAIFIVSLDGVILYCNSGAKRLHRILRKTALPPLTKIHTLFQEENHSKINEMIQAAGKNETDEKELILKKLPTGYLGAEDLEGLGLQARSQPFLWMDKSSVLITFEDASLFIGRRLFLAGIYKNLHERAMEFTEQMESLRCMRSPVDVTALCTYQALCTSYGNALALQYFMLGRVEMRREGFHIRSELEAIMEYASYKAYKNGVDLLLTREDGFPATVFGARLQHEKLLTNMLTLAIEKAKAGSEVSLLCSVEVSTRQSAQLSEIWLGYRVVFKTSELTKEDLDLILITRKQEVKRRTLQDAIHLYNRFGIGVVVIDTLLLMLQGYITSVTQNLLEHSFTIKFQYFLYRDFHSLSMPLKCEGTPSNSPMPRKK